ncbi:predicted protein [Naegleria gruberi]|uniref:Predicted protein n=1 Tax=Naegleria gruberi TaxID=5762 RepID=D2VA37_NAEGR|nr:uncharacterized protein NAEGRDRAFT_32303 [Naegleria gruberi]EFC46360.1 predicted protein [Naegleria gruberi]|eukprot:XP_002679104.1 predicted protein [Naegleria gruberi strain NEG-M]
MLNQYLVGKASDYLPNYKSTLSSETATTLTQDANDPANYQQPLCHQVGLMGKDYFHWVHNTSPVYFKEPVPLFQSGLLEPLSLTPWYVVPLIWIPFIIYNLYISSQIHNSQLSIMFLGYVTGFLAWFGIEILFHKFLFHWDSLGKMGYYLTNIAHFLLHGFHHKVPMDKDRLVVPPTLMCVLSAPVYLLVKFILPSYSNLLIAGAFTGYLFYDMHHYWLHHQTNMKSSLLNPISYYVNSDYWKTLKSHHFIHHFEEGGDYVNYGISNRIIDMMMGTLREEYAK